LLLTLQEVKVNSQLWTNPNFITFTTQCELYSHSLVKPIALAWFICTVSIS